MIPADPLRNLGPASILRADACMRCKPWVSGAIYPPCDNCRAADEARAEFRKEVRG